MADYHLEALNLIKEDNWEKSHQLIQGYSDRLSCLIHGYLHRVEGDQWNADYWYRRVNDTMPINSLEEELTRLYKLLDEL